MCVYIYIYIYIYIYACIYIYICICIFGCLCIKKHSRVEALSLRVRPRRLTGGQRVKHASSYYSPRHRSTLATRLRSSGIVL